MSEAIDIEDIKRWLSLSPKQKSPGLDGLPFEVYSHILNHSKTANLLESVFNDALKGIFPSSWLKTKLILLYKKGDASDLVNWRPLSMINCDPKVFTKIVSKRMSKALADTVMPFQTGFMPIDKYQIMAGHFKV